MAIFRHKYLGYQNCMKTFVTFQIILKKLLVIQDPIPLSKTSKEHLSFRVSGAFIVGCFGGSILCYLIIFINSRINHVHPVNNQQNSVQQAQQKVELGSTLNIVAITVTFWLCFLPASTFHTFVYARPDLWILPSVSGTCLHLYPVICPILLLLCSKSLRKLVWETVQSLK